MNNNYIISTFIHVLDDNTLWNAITKEKRNYRNDIIKFILNNKDRIGLDNIPDEIRNDASIITTQKKEEQLIQSLKEKTTDKQFQGLYLITTTNCNLNCDYCFYRSDISKSLQDKKNMSFEIAKKAIDKFKKIVDNNDINEEYWQQITFYGGEPSLNKELLKKSIPYVRKVFADNYTSIVVNTNLTIDDDELFKIYKDYNVEVQVSLDGMKEQHDMHRKMCDGEGSFDRVIENIIKIKQLGVNIVPMITATDANVNNFSEVLHNIIEKLDVQDFGVNILISDSYIVNKDYPSILAREMLKSYIEFGDKACDYSFIDLYEGILGISKNITKSSCGSGRKITVFPNGNVFSCQALEKHPKNFMGNLDEEFTTNDNWKYWRERNKFSNKKCLECEVIGSCGGGCAQGSYNKNKTIYDVDYNQCEYTKTLFKELHKLKK